MRIAINPKIFLRSSLFLPYLIGALGLAFRKDDVSSWNLLTSYSSAGIFWFYPYTIVMIGLLIWSRKKTLITIATGFLVSPILVGMIFLLYMFLLNLDFADEDLKVAVIQALDSLVFFGIFAIPIILIVGYGFIICVAILFATLCKRGIIKLEEEDFSYNKIANPNLEIEN